MVGTNFVSTDTLSVIHKGGSVTPLKPYEVHAYDWGTAVKHRNGRWETLFISPSGQEIDVSEQDVILHDNGIEFVGGEYNGSS